MRIWLVGLLGLALGIGAARAGEPVPVGEQFQVNSYTTSSQNLGSSAVAVEPQGDFVVVWDSYGSYGTDNDLKSIQGQRYDADGAPVGGEFQVNTYTTSWQWVPAVAVDPQGDFVVVWFSDGSSGTDTDYSSVQAQRYDASGTPVGQQFQVNSYTTSTQTNPAVAVEPQGGFVVVWHSQGSYGTDPGGSIQGQRFDASGTPAGQQFQVNSFTFGSQSSAAVAVEPQGNFVVVWSSDGSDGSNRGIQGQRYDADGAPVGGEFQVNTYTTDDQRRASVSVDADGDFVVVWESYGSYGTDNDLKSIQGQRYDADGAPVGGEFQVNTYTTGYQTSPAVATDGQGMFAVVWESDGSYGTDSDVKSIQGQRYDADGAPVGGEFQVNTYTTSFQRAPALAVEPQGSLVVVWMSVGSGGTDTSGWSIQGQRYSTGAIFTDGFESGDTSAWSSTVP